MQALAIPGSSLRRAIAVSTFAHAVAAVLAGWALGPVRATGPDAVDIELAPPTPLPEALPPEVARPRAPEPAQPPEATAGAEAAAAQSGPGEPSEPVAVDAGVDAPPDARPDAPPDARPDAPPDAAIDAPPDAPPDAAIDAQSRLAAADAGLDAPEVADHGSAIAPGSGSGSGSGAADDTAIAASGSAGSAGSEPARPGSGAGSDTSALAAGSDALALAGSTHPGAGSDTSAAAAGSADHAATTRSAVATAATAPGSGSDAASVGARADTAAVPGDGAGSGAALDTAALAAALAAVEPGAIPGASNEPAVAGAPTTAGTAANLLSYFPDGHIVTALIRFDRLRGTEWAAQTEQLLRPMPDYQLLFGTHDAGITDKLETLVISTPRPRDAAATTLVARTQLSRSALRTTLAAASPVTWSVSRGGLLGRRTAIRATDTRVFLSPFAGWFVLAQPGDLRGLTATVPAAAPGKLDTAVATGPLPPWLAGIRTIERETGDPRGPALVVTLGLGPGAGLGNSPGNGGQRIDLSAVDIGLGVHSVPSPDRISLAMELVPQGWLVRGNARFASDADAAELIASLQQIQQRIAGSRTFQFVLGKPIARVIARLAFARNGPRVSYATSISIADARAILAATAQQIAQYFRRLP